MKRGLVLAIALLTLSPAALSQLAQKCPGAGNMCQRIGVSGGAAVTGTLISRQTPNGQRR